MYFWTALIEHENQIYRSKWSNPLMYVWTVIIEHEQSSQSLNTRVKFRSENTIIAASYDDAINLAIREHYVGQLLPEVISIHRGALITAISKP